MNKNELLVHDHVYFKNMPSIIGEAFYGAWKNPGIGIKHTQYGAYILFYDGQKYFRVGFNNINFNYIERTDKTLPTYPMS